MVELVDLDFDLDEVTDGRARRLQCWSNATGDGDMVVLDQHGVVEAEAVIDAAAATDGVFLQRAETGKRLPRVGDPRLRMRNLGGIGGGERGDAR